MTKKWEYSVIIHAPPGTGGLDDHAFVFQYARDDSKPSHSWSELYRNLGGELLPAKKVGNAEVLSFLGAQGWELVAVERSGEGAEWFFFKRPLPVAEGQPQVEQ